MKISFSTIAHTFVYQMLPASSGALLGSLVSLSFFLLFYTTALSTGGNNMLIIDGFLLFAVTFLVALLSNVLATLFLCLANKKRLGENFRTAMFQIFFVNVAILALSSPLFLLLPKTDGYVLSQFFLPFSALSSTLILQVFLQPKNSLLAAQKTIFSGAIIAFLFFLLFPGVIPKEMISFFLLPIVWFIVPLTSHLFDSLQDLFA